MSFLSIVSGLLGWIYTVLWSLSFYPQTISNHRRKSSSGFSLDFAHLNVVGFLMYTVYNFAFLFSSTIQGQYRDRHNGHENVVRWNDGIFALHGFVLCFIQIVQVYVYPRERGARVSRFARYSLLVIFLTLGITVLLTLPNGGRTAKASESSIRGLQYLDFVNVCSYVKLYCTLVKYLPQMKLNATRKSTRGFMIENILLDFSGGVLSLLQLVIDAGLIQHDWSGVIGNAGKLGLSLISLGYDIILMVQHYILYGDKEPQIPHSPDEEEDVQHTNDTGPSNAAPQGERQPLLQ
ncbi:unnamed protein product [Sympodiomycopsis kandeliae]